MKLFVHSTYLRTEEWFKKVWDDGMLSLENPAIGSVMALRIVYRAVTNPDVNVGVISAIRVSPMLIRSKSMDARRIRLETRKYGPGGKLVRPLMGKFQGQVVCTLHNY